MAVTGLDHVDIDALLAPYSAARLVREHFERSSVFISGTRDKFRDLQLSFDEYFRLCAEGPRGLMAQYFDRGVHEQVYIKGAAARSLYDAGASICVPEVDTMELRYTRLAHAAASAFGVVGRVIMNSYLSSAGGGFGLHFDDRCVLTLQLEGSKRWFYAERPMIQSPPQNLVCGSEEEQRLRSQPSWLDTPWPEQLRTDVLTPGDILYLPAGTPHRTEAGSHSLAITLSFMGRRFADTLTTLMREQLDGSLDWRRRLAPAPEGERQAILKELAGERLRQFRAWLDSVDAEEIAERWRAPS